MPPSGIQCGGLQLSPSSYISFYTLPSPPEDLLGVVVDMVEEGTGDDMHDCTGIGTSSSPGRSYLRGASHSVGYKFLFFSLL